MVRGHTELGVLPANQYRLAAHLVGSQRTASAGCLYAPREPVEVQGMTWQLRGGNSGCGNAGATCALVATDGARVVAISDSKVGLYSDSGSTFKPS